MQKQSPHLPCQPSGSGQSLAGSPSSEAPRGDHVGMHTVEARERCLRQFSSSGAVDRMIHLWAAITKPLSLHLEARTGGDNVRVGSSKELL